MKKLISKIGLLFLLSCFSIPASAFIIGFHITAQYAGVAGKYHVKCYLYRDCSGLFLPMTYPLTYYTTTYSDTIMLNQTSSTSHQFSSYCIQPGPINCNSSINGNGVEEAIYEGELSLPFADSAWVLSVSECCSYSNIFASPAQDICTHARLNTIVAPTDNLPVFDSIPEFAFCLNITTNYTQTATDADGDSIVYSLAPISCYNMQAVYTFPYSGSNFISSSTPIAFNSATGTCQLTPNFPMFANMSIIATEYRNGIAIGSVERNTEIVSKLGIPLALKENSFKPNITIAPNPANNKILINLFGSNNATLLIRNIEGRIITKQNFNTLANIDLESYSSGIYSVSIQTEKELVVSKFIKE